MESNRDAASQFLALRHDKPECIPHRGFVLATNPDGLLHETTCARPFCDWFPPGAVTDWVVNATRPVKPGAREF